MPQKFIFTSESITEGHPDKICDQISDALLDEYLRQDKHSRVAVECFTNTGLVLIGGEVTSKASVDIQKIARQTLTSIGYTDAAYGISAEHASVLVALHEQSSDIAQGVNKSSIEEQGAGDQGLLIRMKRTTNLSGICYSLTRIPHCSLCTYLLLLCVFLVSFKIC
jgi:S-adenosylmethionine synthetase